MTDTTNEAGQVTQAIKAVSDPFWSHFDAIAHKMGEMAPVAYQKFVMYEQMRSIAGLAIGFVLLAFCLGFLKLAFWSWNNVSKKAKALENQGEDNDEIGDDVAGWIFLAIVISIVSGVFGVFGFFHLIDQWSWIGTFAPDARVVRDLLDAVGK